MLVLGGVVAWLYSGIPAQLLTLAQIGGGINTPILGVMTILLVNRKDEMGQFKIGKSYTTALIISYLVIMVTVVNNGINIVSGLIK